jgi:uncharacterized protein YkwD/uncharacterized membrane protein required for colicin V production
MLQTLDYLTLALLALFALQGLRRGLLRTGLDLLILAVTLAAAARWHPQVAQVLHRSLDLPGGTSHLIGYLLIAVVGSVVLLLPSRVFLGLIEPGVRTSLALRSLNHLFGILPGTGRGVIVIGLLALAWLHLPLTDGVRPTGESQITSRLASFAEVGIPGYAAVLERVRLDTTLVAPPVNPAEPRTRRLGFPSDLLLEIDPTGEQTILKMINRDRAHYGIPLLSVDDRLRRVAREHAEEMFHLGYIGQESPIHGTPSDRLRAAGISVVTTDANAVYAPNVDQAYAALMRSAEHRRTMLSPTYHRVGIGVVKAGTWGRMITHQFAD